MFNESFFQKNILRFFIIRHLKKKINFVLFSWRFRIFEFLDYKDINSLYSFFKNKLDIDLKPPRNTSEVYFKTEIILFWRDIIKKGFSVFFLNTMLCSVKILQHIFSDIKIGNGKNFFILFSIIENQWNYKQLKAYTSCYWPEFMCIFFSKELLCFLNKFLKRFYFWINFLKPNFLKETNYERSNSFSFHFIKSIEYFVLKKNFIKIFKNINLIFLDLNLSYRTNTFHLKILINFLLNTKIEHQKIVFHDSFYFSGFYEFNTVDAFKKSCAISKIQILKLDKKFKIFKNSYSKLGDLLNLFHLKNINYLILTNSIERINIIMKITKLYSDKKVFNINLLNKKKKIFEIDRILKKNFYQIYFAEIFSENCFTHSKNLSIIFFDPFNHRNKKLKLTCLPLEREGPFLKFFFLARQGEKFLKLIKKMIARRLEQKKKFDL